jgi:hypothetical protein
LGGGRLRTVVTIREAVLEDYGKTYSDLATNRLNKRHELHS